MQDHDIPPIHLLNPNAQCEEYWSGVPLPSLLGALASLKEIGPYC